MIPDPIHPAVVHFPIALSALLPLFAVAALWAIHSGRLPRSAWLGIVALQALLVASAWIALETGEREEERVEKVVAEKLIEEHEESAQRFLLVAGLALPIAAAGMLGGGIGAAARAVGVVAFLGVLGAGVVTGHRGGELVYRHGAATAYLEPGATAGAPARLAAGSWEEEEDDDD